jgi:hypothetical protein
VKGAKKGRKGGQKNRERKAAECKFAPRVVWHVLLHHHRNDIGTMKRLCLRSFFYGGVVVFIVGATLPKGRGGVMEEKKVEE